MYRTHTCGELSLKNKGIEVTLCGWIGRMRDMGGMTFLDLRDRYGVTQIVFNMETNAALCEQVREYGRECVIGVTGIVAERSNKNLRLPTGEIEILASEVRLFNRSKVPPFTIEVDTDGGDELRMKYRYLDLRRPNVRANLELRHRLGMLIRNYMSEAGFLEIETPFLIKSTPEGARDFVVPSRMNPGEFYALPQSPQTFKQLLMVSGYDKYFQIVRCFRDEDLRADRQPEFTQLDCEMSFVEQDDVLATFEGLVRHLFVAEKGIDTGAFPRMTYREAMDNYGSDKPDIRFDMRFVHLKGDGIAASGGSAVGESGSATSASDCGSTAGGCSLSAENGLAAGVSALPSGKFSVFDSAAWIGGIVAKGCAEYTRKQIDELTEFVKRPQVGASGLVWIRVAADGSVKSSIDKFYTVENLAAVVTAAGATAGDLILIMAGADGEKTREQLGTLRLYVADLLGLRRADEYKPLWVIDFPLLEWNEDDKRFYAKHHPFTSPKPKHIPLLDTDPASVNANAYDLVINGVEIGGGSIRIHDRALQKRMFSILGFTDEEAQKQFGFLMDAFEYGAPPHGGIAFGFDRLSSMFGGAESIRDFIAFPKNNSGRDVMIDSPSTNNDIQHKELNLKTTV
ncbi:MAG: aspartate--tRNA ligase [Bacteroidales bacterium]|jgi:aspartyl-tRNA synthetase|nr:aspartate--tRNA ligase [Bacteroidales bacterium]